MIQILMLVFIVTSCVNLGNYIYGAVILSCIHSRPIHRCQHVSVYHVNLAFWSSGLLRILLLEIDLVPKVLHLYQQYSA